jgi:hypothetical protein
MPPMRPIFWSGTGVSGLRIATDRTDDRDSKSANASFLPDLSASQATHAAGCTGSARPASGRESAESPGV